MGEDVVQVVEDLVDAVDKDWLILIHWHAISTGCVAIWAATILASLCSCRIRVIAMLALPVGVCFNLGNKT